MTLNPESVSAAAVVLAAGQSTRMGLVDGVRKPLIELAGRSVLSHALHAFAASECTSEVVVVARAEDHELARRAVAEAGLADVVTAIVAGGAARTDSVRAGVAAVSNAAGIIMVHDAARPLVQPDRIDAVARAADEFGAALLALPIADTVKRADADGFTSETLDRSTLWAAQTPQAFRASELREALQRAEQDAFTPTDDAALYERYFGRVKLIEGNAANRKLTTPEDLEWFRLLLAERTSDPS